VLKQAASSGRLVSANVDLGKRKLTDDVPYGRVVSEVRKFGRLKRDR
jgi:hypothetical protein